MNFTTKIAIAKTNFPIDYASKIVLLGSCFSENIGNKLSYYKYQNIQNPFGILFHPKAIESLISNALNQKKYSENDVFLLNEQWYCFEAHSKLRHTSKNTLLKNLNNAIKITNNQIHESTHIIITLGTAWAYRFLKSNQLVANCHKVPQKNFIKELLSVHDIVMSLQTIVHSIRSVNTKASIIFTVSPVRHIKDGFIENQWSKSNLISALHSLIGIHPLGVRELYFPSYEIMMDELRDYRFYAEDMLHPNQTAINYIWERFQEVLISNDSLKTMLEVEGIQKGLQHKPFDSNSEAHQKFLKDLEEKKALLQFKFKHICF